MVLRVPVYRISEPHHRRTCPLPTSPRTAAYAWLSLPMCFTELCSIVEDVGKSENEGIAFLELECDAVPGIRDLLLQELRERIPSVENALSSRTLEILLELNDIAKTIQDLAIQVDFWEYAFQFLVEVKHRSLRNALERMPDVILFCGSRSEFAQELINSNHTVPYILQSYIDWDRMGYDMEANGEIFLVAPELYIVNPHDL
ncbi:hypothetical protein FVE85_3283 [Porphyridium purpureum]|uniref:Uncharacterized protein n=1 Tax=Porphyridium purpureum TaxID=35688 RepID=A0A5J4YW50_PORPP|nr:hypothetical protein FVE85_3283 [Porphyridium purpureum]|eukprot:POR6530..scf227_4